MFNLFKKKSKLEILNEEYKKLMKKSHELSAVNRAESDKYYAKADKVLSEIEKLKN